jgi:hypothetical protein
MLATINCTVDRRDVFRADEGQGEKDEKQHDEAVKDALDNDVAREALT